ncbi:MULTISPECIES: NUDIX hydrolase [Bacillus]|uniref:NUDIX hydrolase n=1 Tax=Bacillus TaxID=1386 RepID=UPI000BB96CBE|nr:MULTISPECIES: NUDIX hydrolase [Bacillus]
MIRIAVGALIKNRKNEYLLVEKVKYGEDAGVKVKMKSEWDIPKGGVKKEDESLEAALLRELKEETGSEEYKIFKQYSNKLEFIFPKKVQYQLGYERQLTTIFLVEYTGEDPILIPNDDEIN